MITLEALNLRWLVPTPDDLCAHGDIRLIVDDTQLAGAIDDEDSQNLTVSAAGLYLLRSLETDHTNPNDDTPLFPCCGHTLSTTDEGVYVIGCPNGTDITVSTSGETVTLRRGTLHASLPRRQWRDTVLEFTNQVQAFYDASPPRTDPEPWQIEPWAAFWDEWHRRRRNASDASISVSEE